MEQEGWGFFYVNSYSVSVINNQAGAQVWSQHQLYTRITQQKDRPAHSLCAKADPPLTTSPDTPQWHPDNGKHKADF